MVRQVLSHQHLRSCETSNGTGTSVETEVQGKRQLKLLRFGETYAMNSPKLLIRFLPVPNVEWIGPVRIACKETGLEAQLSYKHNVFGRRNHRSITGKIIDSSSSKTVYEISGHWDRYLSTCSKFLSCDMSVLPFCHLFGWCRTVTIKDISTGKARAIYDMREAISGLSTPYVKDPKVNDRSV